MLCIMMFGYTSQGLCSEPCECSNILSRVRGCLTYRQVLDWLIVFLDHCNTQLIITHDAALSLITHFTDY
jgi:hypothetical protein